MSAYTTASLPEHTRAPEAKTIDDEGTDVGDRMSFRRPSLLDEEKTHEMEAGGERSTQAVDAEKHAPPAKEIRRKSANSIAVQA